MTARSVPDALRDGRGCSVAEGVDAAADLLAAARLPLVWGLVDSTVEAQREAASLADRLRGLLDTALSVRRAGSREAFERIGLLTASLGDVRNHARLLVFWGFDPDVLHAGFRRLYAPKTSACGRVAVDVGESRGPSDVEDRLTVPAEGEIDALLVLRAFVRGRRVEGPAGGLPLGALRALAGRLTACGYGAVLYRADPPLDPRHAERALALSALVRDARRKARLRLLAVGSPSNATGGESVLTWQTGFPSAVSFARGFPRYGPGEFDGESALVRGDVDAALVVGARPSSHLSPLALDALGRTPTVTVAASPVDEAGARGVFLKAAALEDTPGRVFRMDGVVTRRRPRPDGDAGAPTEAEVLARIARAVDRRSAGRAR